MYNSSCWLTGEVADAGVAVALFLEEFTGSERAQALHLVLKQLRQRTEPDRVLACELAWEVHASGYWSQLRDDHDRPYESEEDYFRDVLALTSWRTAYKRLAIGRMLSRIGADERPTVRAAIAEVGVAKAAMVATAIERTGEWARWAALARALPAVTLQMRVSEALQAQPRGREPLALGERFRRAVLSAMPDIEAMEVVERFFELGRRVVGTDHAVGIFLAGCRECLADWEVHTHQRAPAYTRHALELVSNELHEPTDFAHGGNKPFCPRGQKTEGATADATPPSTAS
jgi:hypothetical protein